MPPRARKLSRLMRLPAVLMCIAAVGAGASDNGASWVQVAYGGLFKGHAAGEFEFTRETFEQLIANFRAHPKYKAGAATATAEQLAAKAFDVIPWDFHHASEQGPTSGTVPISGAPAQGWALELDVRTAADGTLQLWAYTRFLEPLRSYVREGKYESCSVTVYFDARDPVSGKSVGPYLSSIAATNDPFLQGMVPLAAERVAAGYHHDPYDTPDGPEDVLACLREVFELPATSELGTVLAEIAKLRAWTAGSAQAPLGVDVGEIVGSIRRLFNLPTLSSSEEVFAAADGLLAALAAASAAAKPPAATGLSKESTMDPKFLKLVAEKLCIPADEEAVQKTIMVRLEAGEGAMASLTAILTALGVEDVNGATTKIAQMFKSVNELEKAMPELASLREQKAKDEDESAEKEVTDAMAAHRMPPAARPALVLMRTGGAPAGDIAKRTVARAAFLAAYPPIAAQHAHLLGNLYGSSTGGAPVHKTQPQGSTPQLGNNGGNGGPDLTSYSGNPTERALAWFEEHDPRAKTLARDAKFHAARKVLADAKAAGTAGMGA